jgi:Uncharacterized protein conserved in bacteria (DUF2188)
MKRPGKLVVPDGAEDARIMAGIEQDNDAWIPSDADWARAEPGRERDRGMEDVLAAASERPQAYHVAPTDGGWTVTAARGQSETTVFARREEAVARARELARGVPGRLIIHRCDGLLMEAGKGRLRKPGTMSA